MSNSHAKVPVVNESRGFLQDKLSIPGDLIRLIGARLVGECSDQFRVTYPTTGCNPRRTVTVSVVDRQGGVVAELSTQPLVGTYAIKVSPDYHGPLLTLDLGFFVEPARFTADPEPKAIAKKSFFGLLKSMFTV